MLALTVAVTLLLAGRAGDPDPPRQTPRARSRRRRARCWTRAPPRWRAAARRRRRWPSSSTTRATSVTLDFRKPPRSGLLFDLDSGRVLWRHRPERVLPIASLTKMMTALVAVDRLPEDGKVLITKQALNYTGSGVGLFKRGRRIEVDTMLHGLMLPSGNDAAIAIAQQAAGTVPAFIALMNARARAMGLACTRFSTVSGIRDAGNHSCAPDLAALARAVLREPRLARIVRRRSAVLPFPIKGRKLYLYNNNPLLRIGYRGTTGVKTGYTEAAGRCLVASVRRGDRRLGVVLLDSPDPGRQAMRLFDRAFSGTR